MAKTNLTAIKWLSAAEAQDFPAAESYLSLLYREKQVRKMINWLRRERVVQFKAKDLFRASRLPLLGVSNSHVKKDWKKIRQGKSLSPLLLVRDEPNGMLVIADGYHRLCAIYAVDEDAWIRCKIV